jgi:hypothetical protein
VTATDLDGDAQPEPCVRRLTVTDGERVLTTLVVDHAGLSGTL